MLRRSTPNHKHSNKPQSPKCFRVNLLAVAQIALLAVAPVAFNVEPNETTFSRERRFKIYPVRPYSWPFWATREEVYDWSFLKELHLLTSSGKMWSSSYYRMATMLVSTDQSNTVYQVLGASSPRGTPVCSGSYKFSDSYGLQEQHRSCDLNVAQTTTITYRARPKFVVDGPTTYTLG